MRPDQHKKKKSTQYKKKHGMVDKDNKDSKNKPTPSQADNTRTSKDETENKDDMVPEGATKDEMRGQRPSHRRRQIVSNWDRYEETPDEDPHIGPTSRGENFLKLLDSAGAVSSQFRFKDEDNWEEVEEQSDSLFLRLDLSSIATTVKCLPLYERLEIDKNKFTEDEIKQMELDANMNSQIRSSHSDTIATKCDTPPLNPNRSEILHNKIDTSSSKLCEDKKLLQKMTASTDTSEKHSIDVERSKLFGVNSNSLVENDLDFLLSLDTPSSVPISQLEQSQVKVNKSQDTQGENSEKQDKNAEESVKPNSENSKDVKESEDLEDWLDSILD